MWLDLEPLMGIVEKIKEHGYDVKISQKKPYFYLLEIYEGDICLFSNVLRRKELSKLLLFVDYLLNQRRKEDGWYWMCN